jgi:hypothetical protein
MSVSRRDFLAHGLRTQSTRTDGVRRLRPTLLGLASAPSFPPDHGTCKVLFNALYQGGDKNVATRVPSSAQQ